jgi:hypothetical protein
MKSSNPFPTFPHGGRSWFDISPLGVPIAPRILMIMLKKAVKS